MGCISENFIVPSRGESVEFKDEDASKQPSLCWETCKAVVNASLALLGKINKEMTVKKMFQVIQIFFDPILIYFNCFLFSLPSVPVV